MPENKKVEAAANAVVSEKVEESAKLTVNDLTFQVTPFTYDGKEYTEIDLRKIVDLTARQLERVEDALGSEGRSTQTMWSTIRGATLLAAAANDMPFDWLDGMKARDVVAVRNAVFAFFIGLVSME